MKKRFLPAPLLPGLLLLWPLRCHASPAGPAAQGAGKAGATVVVNVQIMGLEASPPFAEDFFIINEDPVAMLGYAVAEVPHAHVRDLLGEYRRRLTAARVQVPVKETGHALTFSDVTPGRYWLVTPSPIAVGGHKELIFRPFVVPDSGQAVRVDLVRPEPYETF